MCSLRDALLCCGNIRLKRERNRLEGCERETGEKRERQMKRERNRLNGCKRETGEKRERQMKRERNRLKGCKREIDR